MDTTTNTIDGQTVKGAGDPACRLCGGTGGTWRQDGVYLLGGSCACARSRQWEDAIRRCWPADIRRAAEMAPSASVLTGKTSMNVWVRAERDVLAAHLAVALPATGRIELVRIASDADLAVAWLARVGDKVRDDEVREAMSRDEEDRYDRLVDLVAPPALLVVQLGVKAAALKDLPGLVLETIKTREQRGRPTWIVDTDSKPLVSGHLAYSEDLVAMLATWPQVRIGGAQDVGEAAKLSTSQGARLKKEKAVHPKIQEFLDKHQISQDAYEPQGDKRKGIRMDHPTCGGKKTVSGYYNENRDDCTGKCHGEGCPTKGNAKALTDFLPSPSIKSKTKGAGKTIGAQDLAARLRELLSDGTPRPQSEVKRQLLEAGAYSDETLKRARRLAGVIASDASGAWTWQLPTSPQDRSTSP